MKYKNLFFLLFFNFFLFLSNYSLDINFSEIKSKNNLKQNKKEFKIEISLTEHELILANSLKVSIDSSELKITELKINDKPEKIYLSEYKDDKNAYSKSFTINGLISPNNNIENENIKASIYCSFILEPDNKFIEKIFNTNYKFFIPKKDINLKNN